MKKVFIAIPNMGTLVPELVINILKWSKSTNFSIEIFAPKNLVPMDVARNVCVSKFLQSDCDFIMWIDDDIYCPDNALDKLLSLDKDVVGAVCFAMKYENGEVFPYPVTLRYNENKEYKVYYGNGVEEVDATGGACLLVRRKVYESLGSRPYEFLYKPDGNLALTCDFHVWQKAQTLGFKIFVDFSLICSHIKEIDLLLLNNLLVRLGEKKLNV